MATAAAKKTIHHFVMGSTGTSAHIKGPFVDEKAARQWAAKHRANAPSWLVPAEYIGVVDHKPLDGDGQPVKEG